MSIENRSRVELPDAPADQQQILESGGVACWEAPLVIDTYEPAAPDRYPLFLDRRVYQGSSGRVYPIPFIDRISTEKSPRAWRAIHLENQWLRLVLLPELGGRIHIGYDKTRGYDFFYRNNVIKPALVGLAGPWISGGVEFNWPQHHRPATFLPVETEVERADDGSVTVWHSDLDQLQRMRGTHGVRLRGDSSLIEVDARLSNRTDVPQTFLWWANVAARSHEQYQSFFPTDVRFVADHARRAITAFPRADRPYYGVDYPTLAEERPDADRIDLYSNIPVPTSYMITDTADDFFGGYDHDARAGFVHWADRSIAPGKKQWTWGDGEVGRAWDRHLTDDDGPYVELMAGVFTDNQPDFSWLAAGETRTFSQYWYPIQDIGPAVQATLDAAIGLEVHGTSAELGVAATFATEARIVLSRGDELLGEWTAQLAPGHPFLTTVALDSTACRDDLVVEVRAAEHLLVRWAAHEVPRDEPWVATEPPSPESIVGSDELVLTAQHLVQYRHPTRSPEPYLVEALRRDPGDSRALLALARLEFTRGRYETARDHLEGAIERSTRRNLNPERGDAHLLFALVNERLDEQDAAADAFAKAGWDGALALPAHLGLARIALQRGDAETALWHADLALTADARNSAAIASRVLALARLGRDSAADAELAEARRRDPLDPLLAALDGSLDPADPRTLLTIAHDLARLGEPRRAVELAERAATRVPGPFGNPAPLAHYAIATFLERSRDGDEAERLAAATAARRRAAAADPLLAFPAGLDDLDALRAAIASDPGDTAANGYLGSWLLDAGRLPDALAALEIAIAGGSADPVVWRNAAVALVNADGDLEEADRRYAHALDLSPSDPRLVYERDQLAALRGTSAVERLTAIIDAGPEVLVRDDLAIGYAGLLVDVGCAGDALAFLGGRSFQPFEGGEGKVIAVFDRASTAVARELLDAEPAAAAELLRSGIRVPVHLGEGRHPAEPIAERLVLLGDAEASIGHMDAARAAWRAARSNAGPLAVDERHPDERDAWVGIGHVRLGEFDAAEHVWKRLEARAAELEAAPDRVDYFATSLPELLLFPIDSAERRRQQANGLRAAAAAGRSATTNAQAVPVSRRATMNEEMKA